MGQSGNRLFHLIRVTGNELSDTESLFLTKLRPFQTRDASGYYKYRKRVHIFKVWKIDLKLCIYFTEEDAYLLFDRKNQGHFKL